MAEQKRKMQIFGKEVDVTDVPTTSADEKFNEYTLEDGSKLRVKNVVTCVTRIDDQFNQDGTPVYIVLTSPVVIVVSSPLSKANSSW